MVTKTTDLVTRTADEASSATLSRAQLLGAAAAGAAALGVASFGTLPIAEAASGSITVGAKDFTEDQLLGHMYALLLQQAGFKVSEKFPLPTAIAQAALVKGDIDLYPEYTGTGLQVILKTTAANSAQAYYTAVAKGYEQQFHLTWLDPSPFNDTQGLATTQSVSKQYGIKTFSDMVKQASKLRFVANAEFIKRPDGLPGLKKVYGNFSFKSIKVVPTPGLRYQALKNGLGDVVVAFTTDGPLVADHLVLLDDDKHYAPFDQVAPVVRDNVLKAHPEIKGILNKLAPKLTQSAIQKMNYLVDGQGKDLNATAKAFLQQQGLLK